MTAVELSDYLRITRSTLYRLLKAKKIPSFRIGSEHRFSRRSIDEWLRAQEAKSTSNGAPVGALSEALPAQPSWRRGRPPRLNRSP